MRTPPLTSRGAPTSVGSVPTKYSLSIRFWPAMKTSIFGPSARETLSDTLGVLGRPRTLGLVFNDDDRTTVPTLNERNGNGWRRFVGAARG